MWTNSIRTSACCCVNPYPTRCARCWWRCSTSYSTSGELSIPGYELLKAEAVLQLDEALAHHNAALPRLQEFILPAGTRAASQAHVCRTVARRAERIVVALGNEEAINDAPRQYLNRLSDLMFVLARVLNRVDGGDDVYWKSERMAQQNATE